MFFLFDKKLPRFLLVGLINTLAGSAIMFSLYNIVHVNYWAASCANYTAASILSFFLNKYFTFGVKAWSLFMICAFIAVIAVSYGIAYGISKPLVSYLLKTCPVKTRENIALFTGMCFFTGLNYIGQRLLVFRDTANTEK